MIALHIEDQRVGARRAAIPKRKPGHALIRLRLAGICNTDIELLRGYYGFRGRPGHEFVGDVVDADTKQWIGKRVVGEINLACMKCDWCARGLARHCPRRTVLGIVKHPGAFAEYLTLPEANLRAVPRNVPDAHAVFTEPVAAACEILDQVRIAKDERVAVLGDGKLGLLIAQVLALSGCDVHLFGRHQNKLDIAAPLVSRASARLPRASDKYRYTVDATGSADALAQAVAMTLPRGTLVMKSTVHGAVALDAAPVIVNEITLVGSRCGRFEPALKILKSGKLNLDAMIDCAVPLGDGRRAFERAQERGVLKVLLHP